MNRRSFLRAALLGATLPGLLRSAFAGSPDASLPVLSAAWQRAREQGRLLLVILIPDDAEKYFRGGVLGPWLNHAEPEVMAALGSLEVVCATIADVGALLPSAPIGPETWMLVVDPSQMPASATPVDLPMSEANREPRGLARVPDDPTPDWREDPTMAGWAAGSPDMASYLDRRQREDAPEILLSRRYGATISAALLAALPPGLLPDSEVDRAARAKAATEALRDHSPMGAHWATNDGCGTTIEDVDQNWAFGCGMGHVNARDRRFLYLFPVAAGPRY